MGNSFHPLHIFFFPFMSQGHIIPMVDMAKLFASKGVKATIITTPLKAPLISKAIENSRTHCNQINILTIKFPCVEAGLPDGCENTDSLPSPDFFPIFVKAIGMLQEPFEQQLHKKRPDCVIADMFFTWATDSAAKFEIPRIVFHGFGYFSLCATECMRLYEPHKNVSSDSESFAIPNLPGEVKITRLQVPHFDDEWKERIAKISESEVRSYGVVVNSFYELERVYADHYKNVMGRKAWGIGPLSLCNINKEEKTYLGHEASIHEHECLKWLDTKKPNSVVYVCFGSMTNFPDCQLREIAIGLEASGQKFMWVVRKNKKDGEDGEEWLPEGFEKRMEGKGLIIRGWAPQVLILEHEAIGAFVTHCGWNSTLEGVAAGVPLVTWPVSAEQFYNEKLVIEFLKIGVPVGVKKWATFAGDNSIKWDAIDKVVKKIMAGEEAAEEMRKKAKMFSRMARQAVEEGGSSYSDFSALVDELSLLPR